MQDLVDQLSRELSNKYVNYIETFMVDLWSEDGFIEFRCGLPCAAIMCCKAWSFRLPAASGTSDAERAVLTRAVFEELEKRIDLAITKDKVSAN